MNTKEFSLNYFEFGNEFGKKNVEIMEKDGMRITSVGLISSESDRINSGWMTQSTVPRMILADDEKEILRKYRSVLNGIKMIDECRISIALRKFLSELITNFQKSFLAFYSVVFVCFPDTIIDCEICLEILEEFEIEKLPIHLIFVKMKKESLILKRYGDDDDEFQAFEFFKNRIAKLGKRIRFVKLRDFDKDDDDKGDEETRRENAMDCMLDENLDGLEEEIMEFYESRNEIWW